MGKQDQDTWNCPICSLEKLKYGENCPLWEKGECKNPPNANGQWYNRNKKKKDETKAIGIGAISDEI